MNSITQQRFFLIFVSSMILFSSVSSAFATASITLTPSSGFQGSISSISGSGFPSSSENLKVGHQGNPFGQNITNYTKYIYAEPFTTGQTNALPAHAMINKFGLNITSVGNGTYLVPQDQLYSYHYNNTSLGYGYYGTVYAEPFLTSTNNLAPMGSIIQKINYNVTNPGIGLFNTTWTKHAPFGSSCNGYDGAITLEPFVTGWSKATAWDPYSPGNIGGASEQIIGVKFNVTNVGGALVNIKFYSGTDSGSVPTNLLGEADGLTFAGTGLQLLTLSNPIKVPSNGIVWAGLESSSSNLLHLACTTSAGGIYGFTHTFGTGPSSVPADNYNNDIPFIQLQTKVVDSEMRFKIYDANGTGNNPGNLLGESNSISISTNGVKNTTLTGVGVNIQVPYRGLIWGALETNNSRLGLWATGSVDGVQNVAHVFGSGPNPFGTSSTNGTLAPFMRLYTKIDNSTIRLKIYDATGSGGNPGNLLGETNPIEINKTGLQNFTMPNIAAPSNGNVWAALEVNSTKLNLAASGTANGIANVIHTFGSGPNPFGTAATLGTSAPFTELYSVTSANNMTFKWDGSSLPTSPTSIFTDDHGGFSGVTFTVPTVPGGSHTVQATDSYSNSASASFSILPEISISPNVGPTNTLVTVSGSGFAANKLITIDFDGGTMGTTPATVTTDSSGDFSGVTFHVPIVASGSHTVQAVDSIGNSASQTFTVNTPTLTVTPTSGQVNIPVTLEGSTFAASDTITIKYDGITLGTTPSNSGGSFSTIFDIPNSAYGSHTITAQDTHSGSATTIFSVTPNLIMSPVKGSKSSTVNLSGNGFAGSSSMSFYFNNAAFTTSPSSVTTNSTGGFSGVTFTVPNFVDGSYPVKAVDASGHSYTLTFTVHQSEPDAPTLGGYAVSTTSVRFTSVAGASSGDHPVQWYSLKCSLNGGAYSFYVTNSTEPSPRTYDITGLQPTDSITCQWRDGSSSGWSNWSNAFNITTQLEIIQKPQAPNSNPLFKFENFIDAKGGIYFGFTIIPFIIMLLGMMATPKTTGIFTIITLSAMAIVQGAGLFVYPAWYWGLSILFGIVLILSRANEK